MDVQYYIGPRGEIPFVERLESFDYAVRARIKKARFRWKQGNLGHVRALGSGLCEIKMNFGSGIRVYFGKKASQVILLLLCGDKATQSRDIFLAKQYWIEHTKGAGHAASHG